MDIAVIISDQRMALIAAHLSSKASITLIKDQQDINLAKKENKYFDAIVLPMSGVDEEGSLLLNNKLCNIIGLLELRKDNLIIFSGVVNTILLNQKALIINLSNYKGVKNCIAALTAQGILALLITKTDEDFRNYRYDILGDGACGSAILDLLLDNHCYVRLVSRNKPTSTSYPHIDYPTWYQREPGEIIINTAAACVIHGELVKSWKKRPFIIDIANKGIGVDPSVLKEFDVLIAGALPNLSGVATVAKMISDTIIKEMKL